MNGFKEFVEKIMEAKRLARIEHIKANSILINTNFVKIPKLTLVEGGGVCAIRPMICGLEMVFTDKELPDNYSFAITDGGETERDRLVGKAKLERTKEIFEKILGYIGSQQQFCIVDEEHKTLIDCDKLFDFVGSLAKEYGVEREEYDELQKGIKTYNYTAMFDAQNAYRWEQGYLQGAKETAEKFAFKANTIVNNHKKSVGMGDYVVDAERMIFEINKIEKDITEEKI